jgi:hypothetical protein
VGTGKIEKSVEFNDGYSESWDEKTWVVRCECGKEFEVEQKGFKKKEHKDCGCGAAQNDGAVVATAMTMPLQTRQQLQVYARKYTNGNVSMAIVKLIRDAMKREQTENEDEVTHAR